MKKKNVIQSILIAFILFAHGFLYAKSDYKSAYEPSDLDTSIFYTTEVIIFVLTSFYGIYSNNDKNFKVAWIILAVFFLIRLTWEIKAAIYGMNINEKKAVAILFIADAVAVFVITYLPFLNNIKKKWQRSK